MFSSCTTGIRLNRLETENTWFQNRSYREWLFNMAAVALCCLVTVAQIVTTIVVVDIPSGACSVRKQANYTAKYYFIEILLTICFRSIWIFTPYYTAEQILACGHFLSFCSVQSLFLFLDYEDLVLNVVYGVTGLRWRRDGTAQWVRIYEAEDQFSDLYWIWASWESCWFYFKSGTREGFGMALMGCIIKNLWETSIDCLECSESSHILDILYRVMDLLRWLLCDWVHVLPLRCFGCTFSPDQLQLR